MEAHPGVFVSSIATNEWKPDPEVGGEMHVLVEDERAYAGMSRFLDVADLQSWTLPERETIQILEGAARIEIDGGPTLVLKVGDLASLPKGAVIAVLEGNPNKEGPFVFRVKIPDGYRVPPHTHPKTERVTVISGTFNIGMGDKFDEKKTRPMPAGTFGHWPAGMKQIQRGEFPHFFIADSNQGLKK